MHFPRKSALFFFGPVLFFLFFATAHLAHGAFGVSPPFLNADHLVPGITYTQTIYLVQDHPDINLPIKAVLTLPDKVTSWITIDKGTSFVIPQGVHQFPVTISVHIPNNETIGKYTGDIAFTSQPSQAGQVTIALGVDVAVNLTIGNNIFEQYTVPLITFPDIEEGWNPRVDVKFQNDGNIPESFDSATLDIYDQYDAVRLAYITKQSGFPETPAFTIDQYTLEFPTDFHLGIGQYWGLVTFYKNQKAVATQKTIFNVVKAGSISGPWGLVVRFLTENQVAVYGGIVLIIVLIGLAVRRSRGRRRRSA